MNHHHSLLWVAAMILTMLFITSIADERSRSPGLPRIDAGPSVAPPSVPAARDRAAAALPGPRRPEREIAVTYDFGNAPAPEHPSVFAPPAKESVRETPLVLDEARHSPGTVPAATPEPGEALVRAGPPGVRAAAVMTGRVRGRVVSGATTFFDEDEYLRYKDVRFPADAKRGLPNAVVVVAARENGPAEAEGALTVEDEEFCVIHPHVAAVQKGARFVLRNAGALGHRLRLDSIVNPAREIDLKAGATVETEFGRPEEFSVYCALHRGRRGWIAVAAGPCFALTDEEGAFVIEGVPAGTYDVRVWHERFNPVQEAVTVEPGKDAEINIWMAEN